MQLEMDRGKRLMIVAMSSNDRPAILMSHMGKPWSRRHHPSSDRHDRIYVGARRLNGPSHKSSERPAQLHLCRRLTCPHLSSALPCESESGQHLMIQHLSPLALSAKLVEGGGDDNHCRKTSVARKARPRDLEGYQGISGVRRSRRPRGKNGVCVCVLDPTFCTTLPHGHGGCHGLEHVRHAMPSPPVCRSYDSVSPRPRAHLGYSSYRRPRPRGSLLSPCRHIELVCGNHHHDSIFTTWPSTSCAGFPTRHGRSNDGPILKDATGGALGIAGRRLPSLFE